LKKYPWNKTECELIHNEIFQTTTEHKYYTLGVAQGFYHIYQMLNRFKEQNFTSLELMEIIKHTGAHDSKINEYFSRLLQDLENE